MLTHLHIENYALIRQSDIDFEDGFVAITGETGAGKSILLGALSLLLGQRADTKVLYDPQRKCIVEAVFNITRDDIKDLFEANDVDYTSDGEIIIRREILTNAKSRAFVNDTPVPVSFLKELGSHLIDIHSQHATLLLGDSTFQISVLDSIGSNHTLITDYQAKYCKYIDNKHQLERLTAEEQQNRKDFDYNKFLYDELLQANLQEGEQESLEEESTLLANAENIKQTLSQVSELCDGEEDSALQRLNMSKSLLGKTASYHKEIDLLYGRLDSSLIELRDIISTIESIYEQINYSPERQQTVEERLDTIYRLQKKHNVNSIAELLEVQNHLESLINRVDDTERMIHETMEAVDKSFAEVQRAGEELSVSRKKAAKTLEKSIAPLFADLGMENATFKAVVNRATEYGYNGNDSVMLLFNANKGGELRELGKVASGGEMSRLMLAIKSLTAQAGLLPTVIFDEIDSGISGDISVKVGRIMRRMAETMQVIAITHLPQIAARASQHYKVYKAEEKELTASNIRLLTNDERKYELAVMLSAEPPTKAALQTASELMTM
ncbi:MAG: DNA repair protein RecN [Bacteroidales bacterium]|nr:DNA repair protein RecN [Bacteroidales bacterium]